MSKIARSLVAAGALYMGAFNPETALAQDGSPAPESCAAEADSNVIVNNGDGTYSSYNPATGDACESNQPMPQQEEQETTTTTIAPTTTTIVLETTTTTAREQCSDFENNREVYNPNTGKVDVFDGITGEYCGTIEATNEVILPSSTTTTARVSGDHLAQTDANNDKLVFLGASTAAAGVLALASAAKLRRQNA